MTAIGRSKYVSSLPKDIDDWPSRAQKTYLEANMSRDGLADIIPEEAHLDGAERLCKSRLARIAVEFGDGGGPW